MEGVEDARVCFPASDFASSNVYGETKYTLFLGAMFFFGITPSQCAVSRFIFKASAWADFPPSAAMRLVR
jgi:hypothetical protein